MKARSKGFKVYFYQEDAWKYVLGMKRSARGCFMLSVIFHGGLNCHRGITLGVDCKKKLNVKNNFFHKNS